MKLATTIYCLSVLFVLVASPVDAAGEKSPQAWTDPDVARREDPDFSIQGEYGSASIGATTGVQVVALGNGEFAAYLLQDGLPGLGWTREKSRSSAKSRRRR